MNKRILSLLLSVFFIGALFFPFLIEAVDPGCSEQTPTCLGIYKVDVFSCKQNALGYCAGGTEVTRQATVYCDSNCEYNICSSNDTITCTNESYTIEGITYYYCAESGCNTAGNCCGGSGTFCGDGSCNGSETCSSCPGDCGSCTCPDSCNVNKLVDHDSNCTNDSGCGTGATRYTGGECSVCPLNNNSCSSKYLDNTATSGDCVIPENMWSNIDKDFTISHNVTFPGSATLTIKRNLILNSGGKITVSSGATIIFYIGKEIKMQGGEISLTGGYILNQNP